MASGFVSASGPSPTENHRASPRAVTIQARGAMPTRLNC